LFAHNQAGRPPGCWLLLTLGSDPPDDGVPLHGSSLQLMGSSSLNIGSQVWHPVFGWRRPTDLIGRR